MNNDDVLIISSVLNDGVTVDEFGVSLAQKWIHVKQTLGSPDVNIMTHFESKSFEEVYKTVEGSVLDAFIYAAQLRIMIFDKMVANYSDEARKKHLQLCGDTAYYWCCKMFDKKDSLENGEKMEHLWLN